MSPPSTFWLRPLESFHLQLNSLPLIALHPQDVVSPYLTALLTPLSVQELLDFYDTLEMLENGSGVGGRSEEPPPRSNRAKASSSRYDDHLPLPGCRRLTTHLSAEIALSTPHIGSAAVSADVIDDISGGDQATSRGRGGSGRKWHQPQGL